VNQWKVILATLVIFGAGVITGALAINLATHQKQKAGSQAHAQKSKPAPSLQKPEFVARLDRELVLTSEQRAQIEKALSESHKRTKALWEPLQPNFREEVARLQNEIRATLEPRQASKFDQLLKAKPAKKGDETAEARNKEGKPLRPPTMKPPIIPAPALDKKGAATNPAPGEVSP